MGLCPVLDGSRGKVIPRESRSLWLRRSAETKEPPSPSLARRKQDFNPESTGALGHPHRAASALPPPHPRPRLPPQWGWGWSSMQRAKPPPSSITVTPYRGLSFNEQFISNLTNLEKGRPEAWVVNRLPGSAGGQSPAPHPVFSPGTRRLHGKEISSAPS